MFTTRISSQPLREVEQALARYREVLAALEQDGVLTKSTEKTYWIHSENFVRWLRGEFDPASRNKS